MRPHTNYLGDLIKNYGYMEIMCGHGYEENADGIDNKVFYVQLPRVGIAAWGKTIEEAAMHATNELNEIMRFLNERYGI